MLRPKQGGLASCPADPTSSAMTAVSQKRVALVCDDDEEAKRVTEQLVDGHAIELWQQARKVATFEPAK
jgi:hypothetical protein